MGGLASAAMVAIGYPGEIQDKLSARWIYWACAMVPFAFVVLTLVAGLNGATAKQPDSVKSLVVSARYLTVISWLTYPGVYIIKSMGLAGKLPPLTSKSATRSPMSSLRRCSASSFGPLLQVS